MAAKIVLNLNEYDRQWFINWIKLPTEWAAKTKEVHLNEWLVNHGIPTLVTHEERVADAKQTSTESYLSSSKEVPID